MMACNAKSALKLQILELTYPPQIVQKPMLPDTTPYCFDGRLVKHGVEIGITVELLDKYMFVSDESERENELIKVENIEYIVLKDNDCVVKFFMRTL